MCEWVCVCVSAVWSHGAQAVQPGNSVLYKAKTTYTPAHTHTHTHTHGGGCHVNQWVRPFREERGEGGIPFFFFKFFWGTLCFYCSSAESSQFVRTWTLQTRSPLIVTPLVLNHAAERWASLKRLIHACSLFLCTWGPLRSVTGPSVAVYTERAAAANWTVFTAQIWSDAGNKSAVRSVLLISLN